MLVSLAALVFGVFVGYAVRCDLIHRWVDWHKRLPPGTMGWPFIGETLQLYSGDPNTFFTSKHRRYGKIFKTHVLGCPCVMIASPEAAKFVLSARADLFRPTFPASKQKIIGPQALFFHEGPYHARLRRLVLSALLPDYIRRLVPHIEQLAISTLHSWEGTTVNTFAEMKKFTFKVIICKICDSEGCLDMEDLNLAYSSLENGYNCMPINMPGTKYHNAMQARKHLNTVITGVMRKRRAELEGGGRIGGQDILGRLLTCHFEKGGGSEGGALTEEQIVDNIIGLIFASRDTTASVMTWLIKFLWSNPALLDSVIVEQETIRQAKAPHLQNHLTWKDTRKMSFTTRAYFINATLVIQETLRVATVLSFTFREAIEDVEYEGYLIPKGWKVLPLFEFIHHNPNFFPDPHKFDPSRFEYPIKATRFYHLAMDYILALVMS